MRCLDGKILILLHFCLKNDKLILNWREFEKFSQNN